MKIRILRFIVSVFTTLLFVNIYAGAPTWERVNYTNSTTFVGYMSLSYEGVSEGDYLGAFVGDECRMISTFMSLNDTLFTAGVLHGGTVDILEGGNGEVVTFKLWKTDLEEEIELPGTTVTKPGGRLFMYEIAPIILEATRIEISGIELNETFNSNLMEYSATLTSNEFPAKTDYIVEVADPRTEITINPATGEMPNNVTEIILSSDPESSEDDIIYTITFNVVIEDLCEGVTLTAPELSNLTACGEEELPSIIGQSIAWYEDEDTTKLIKIADIYTFTSETTVYAVQLDENFCRSADVASSTLTISDIPDAPELVTAHYYFCEGESLNKQELLDQNPNLHMYADKELTIEFPFVETADIQVGDFTYYITQDIGGCESSPVELIETIHPKPNAKLTAESEEVCATGSSIKLTMEPIGTLTGKNIEESMFNPEGLTAGTYTISLKVIDENECKDSAKLDITVVETEAPILESPSYTIHEGDTEIPTFVVSNVIDSVEWYSSIDEFLSSESEFTPEITTDKIGTIEFTAINYSNGCASKAIPATININSVACDLEAPTVVAVGYDDLTISICENEIAPLLTATADEGATILWTTPKGDKVTYDTITPNVSGKYYASQQIASEECISPYTEVNITINPLPSIEFELADSIFETDDPIELLATPEGGIFTMNDSEITSFDPSIGVDTYSITYTVSLDNCENSVTNKITVKKEEIIVDTKILQETITAAKEALSANIYNKGVDDKITFQNAIDAATSVLENTEASQQEINEATTTLENAINEFNTPNPFPDTSALDSVIAVALQVYEENPANKSDEERTDFRNGIEAAELVRSLISEETSQNQVDEYVTVIEAEIKKFITPDYFPDTTAIAQAITQAKIAIENNPANKSLDEIEAFKVFVEEIIAYKEGITEKTLQSEIDKKTLSLETETNIFTKIVTDKTALNSVIDAAKQILTSEDLSTKAYEDLELAISDAENIYNDDDAIQSEIDEAKSKLETAITKALDTLNSLDTVALEDAILKAEEALDLYSEEKTVAEYKNFLAKITAAKTFISNINEETTQDEVDEVLKQLSDTTKAYIPSVIDTTLLTDAISNAKKILEENPANKTGDDITAFETAISDAENKTETIATIEELNDAISELKKAQTKFSTKVFDNSELIAELERLIDIAEKIIKENPLDADTENMETALDNAKDVDNNSANELEAAIEDLNNEINLYNSNIDYSKLLATIGTAESELERARGNIGNSVGQYSQEIYNMLTKAVVTAKTYKTSSSQTEVNNATADLELALENFTINKKIEIYELEDAVKDAEAILADEKANPGLYKSNEIEDLKAVTDAAKLEISNPTSQETVDSILIVLLEKSDISPIPTELDFTDLKIAIAVADYRLKHIYDSLNVYYTNEQYKTLFNAKKEGVKVKETAKTQTLIDDATQAIYDAIPPYPKTDSQESIEGVTVYPTITENTITIGNITSATSIIITASSGKIIFSSNSQSNDLTIDLSPFAQDVYTIILHDKRMNIKTFKVVKL